MASSSYLQVWFSINLPPPLPPLALQEHKNLFENTVYPVGNVVDSRCLVSCMTDDYDAVKAALESFGKVLVFCGAIDAEGYFVGEVNEAEFDKFMQPYYDNQGNLITPTDFTTAGYVGFKDGKIREA